MCDTWIIVVCVWGVGMLQTGNYYSRCKSTFIDSNKTRETCVHIDLTKAVVIMCTYNSTPNPYWFLAREIQHTLALCAVPGQGPFVHTYMCTYCIHCTCTLHCIQRDQYTPSRGYGCALRPRTRSNWIELNQQPWSLCNQKFMCFFIFPYLPTFEIQKKGHWYLTQTVGFLFIYFLFSFLKYYFSPFKLGNRDSPGKNETVPVKTRQSREKWDSWQACFPIRNPMKIHIQELLIWGRFLINNGQSQFDTTQSMHTRMQHNVCTWMTSQRRKRWAYQQPMRKHLSIWNFGKYRRIKACRPNGLRLYVQLYECI